MARWAAAAVVLVGCGGGAAIEPVGQRTAVAVDVGAAVLAGAGFIQWEPAVASDGTDYLVVWQDLRTETSYDLFGARVDPGGSVLDPYGIPIATDVARQERAPVVAFAGADYLVVWTLSDLADGSWINGDVRAARVGRDGVVLDPDGIALTAAPGDQQLPAVAALGDQWLVIWRQQATAGGPIELRGRRLSAGGAPIGDEIAVAGEVSPNGRPRLAADGDGWLVVWLGTGGPRAARIDAGGAVLDPGGVALAPWAASWLDVAYGGGTYLATWVDAEYHRVLATRIDPASGEPLDFGGLLVHAGGEDDYYGGARVAHDGSDFVVLWDHSLWDGVLAGDDILAARVSAGGEVLDAPATITSADYFQHSPAVARGGGGLLAAWIDNRLGGGWQDIFAAIVAPGPIGEEPPGFLASTSANEQRWQAAASDGVDYLVAWTDHRAGTHDVLAAAPAGDDHVVAGESAVEYRPRLAFDGERYFAVYAADPEGCCTIDLYGRHLGADGAPLEEAPIAIALNRDEAAWNHDLARGPGGYLVVWDELDRVIGRWLGDDGVPLAEPFPINEPPAPGVVADLELGPRAAALGGEYLVVWSADNLIRGARLAAAGEVTAIFSISAGASFGFQGAQVVAAGADSWLVVWERNGDLLARLVSAGGAPVGAAFAVAGGGVQSRAAVAWDGYRWLVAWAERTHLSGQDDLRGRWFDAAGAPIGEAFVLAEGPWHEWSPEFAPGPLGAVLLTFTRYDDAADRRVRRVRADFIRFAAPHGAGCADGVDCTSGICLDGMCCDASCDGPCVACSIAAGAAVDGLCRPRADGIACDDGDACSLPDACSAGVCAGEPALAVDPDPIELPDTPVGGAAGPIDVVVTNRREPAIRIAAIESSDPAIIVLSDPSPIALAGGESVTAQIEFRPGRAGTYDAALQIETDECAEIEIAVGGVAIDQSGADAGAGAGDGGAGPADAGAGGPDSGAGEEAAEGGCSCQTGRGGAGGGGLIALGLALLLAQTWPRRRRGRQ